MDSNERKVNFMFNHVWFYVVLYVMAGIGAVIADAKIHMRRRAELDKMGWAAACRFDDESLIDIQNPVLRWCYIVAAFFVWPISVTVAMTRKIIVYEKIMEEEKEKKRMEEIHKEFKEQKERLAR